MYGIEREKALQRMKCFFYTLGIKGKRKTRSNHTPFGCQGLVTISNYSDRYQKSLIDYNLNGNREHL